MANNQRIGSTMGQLDLLLARVDNVSLDDRGLVLIKTMEVLNDVSTGYSRWLQVQLLRAIEYGDYGPPRCFAALVDVPDDAKRVSDVLGRLEQSAYEYLIWRGKDLTRIRPFPGRPGAPTGEQRLIGRILFRQGLRYRDVMVAMWWRFAPYSLSELRSDARNFAFRYSENGARDWLAGRARGLQRSLDRAWDDIYASRRPRPGLHGFTALSTNCLCEWPSDALETIRQSESNSVDEITND